MRSQGLSLAKAAAEAGTTPRTIQRHVGKALVQRDDGRYTATKYDRIPRRVVFTTPRGSIQLTVRDSRTVGRMAKYHAAVSDYLKTGDTRPLRAFRGKAIRVDKVAYPFITDPRTLERLAHAGEVTFEDFYALTTGEAK